MSNFHDRLKGKPYKSRKTLIQWLSLDFVMIIWSVIMFHTYKGEHDVVWMWVSGITIVVWFAMLSDDLHRWYEKSDDG